MLLPLSDLLFITFRRQPCSSPNEITRRLNTQNVPSPIYDFPKSHRARSSELSMAGQYLCKEHLLRTQAFMLAITSPVQDVNQLALMEISHLFTPRFRSQSSLVTSSAAISLDPRSCYTFRSFHFCSSSSKLQRGDFRVSRLAPLGEKHCDLEHIHEQIQYRKLRDFTESPVKSACINAGS